MNKIYGLHTTHLYLPFLSALELYCLPSFPIKTRSGKSVAECGGLGLSVYFFAVLAKYHKLF